MPGNLFQVGPLGFGGQTVGWREEKLAGSTLAWPSDCALARRGCEALKRGCPHSEFSAGRKTKCARYLGSYLCTRALHRRRLRQRRAEPQAERKRRRVGVGRGPGTGDWGWRGGVRRPNRGGVGLARSPRAGGGGGGAGLGPCGLASAAQGLLPPVLGALNRATPGRASRHTGFLPPPSLNKQKIQDARLRG